MTWFTSPAQIPHADRLTRICELLFKAMRLEQARCVVTREVEVLDETGGSGSVGNTASDQSEDARLEAYIAMRGEASPAMIRTTLGWPRTRVYRAAHRLQSAGRIVSVGQTRGLVYRLNPQMAGQVERN